MGCNKFIYLSMLLAVIFTMAAAVPSDGHSGSAAWMDAIELATPDFGQQYEVTSAFESIPRSSILNKLDSGIGSFSKGSSKGYKFLKRACAVSLLAKAENRRHTVEHCTHYPLCIGYNVHCIDFFSRLNV